MKHALHLLLQAALTGALLAACSGSESTQNQPPSGAGGAAGSGGGTAGAAGAASPTCVAACEVTSTCLTVNFDKQKCEVQCDKELTGKGYFDPEFAKLLFGRLAKHGPDPHCELMGPYFGYGFANQREELWLEPPTAYNVCAAYNGAACGYDSYAEWAECKKYYPFREDFRKEVAECWKQHTCPSDCWDKGYWKYNHDYEDWFGQNPPP